MITFSEAQLMAWIAPIAWPFLRMLALMTAAPIYSQRAFPIRSRIGLALLVAVAAQPSLPQGPMPSLTDPEAPLVVAQQLLVGLAMGFAARVVLAAFEFAGEIIGLQMGLNYAGFFDPGSGATGNAVGRFEAHIALLLFLVLDGHLLMAQALVRSFTTFAVDASPLATLQALPLHRLGVELFAQGLWLALPLIGLLCLVNIVLGVMARVAPQMNVFAVGFPVTLSVGLLGLVATLPAMETPLMRLMEQVLSLF